MPWVDELLAARARGAAFQHLADAHGLALDALARERLASPLPTAAAPRWLGRALRTVTSRLALPLRAVMATETGWRTALELYLFARYLAHRPASAGPRLDVAEAEALRAAWRAALRLWARSAWPALVQQSWQQLQQAARLLPLPAQGLGQPEALDPLFLHLAGLPQQWGDWLWQRFVPAFAAAWPAIPPGALGQDAVMPPSARPLSGAPLGFEAAEPTSRAGGGDAG
ncbi:MAG: hypothetical protein ACPGUV_06720 [Polyangiales bacterium]